MSKFLTLMRRDFNEHKGALFFTPLGIAAFIIGIVLLSAAFGKLNYGGQNFNLGESAPNFNMNIDDENGKEVKIYKNSQNQIVVFKDGVEKPIKSKFDNADLKKASEVFAFGNGAPSFIPLFVAMIASLFIFAGSLYEERKDKSIMFWKSLPITDLETVLSKFLTIGVGGAGIAFVISALCHVCMILITYTIAVIFGVNFIDIGIAFSAAFEMWGVIIYALLIDFLWVAPIFAWFLFMSAYAPKSPFFAAILPIVLLPLVGKIFFDGKFELLSEPLSHLVSYPIIENIKNIDENSGARFSGLIIEAINKSLSDPSLWVGLVIGAALLYATAEVRKRRIL